MSWERQEHCSPGWGVHNLLSQCGVFSSGPGNYGENIVTGAAVMCHALSRKSRDTHFRDHHLAAPEQHLSRQPCTDPGSDVQSIAEESEADLKLRITMTHEEG